MSEVDLQSVKNAMHGVDYIFHAAALKQVPSCEFFPMEAVQTNVDGTNNVLLSAIAHGVKNVVVLSTDKAAYPVNAMGTSKAMMEKVIVAQSKKPDSIVEKIIKCDFSFSCEVPFREMVRSQHYKRV